MTSSFSVAVRSFVTIVSLVAIPLFAVVGVKHGEVARWIQPVQRQLARAGWCDPPVGESLEDPADELESQDTESQNTGAGDEAPLPPRPARSTSPAARPARSTVKAPPTSRPSVAPAAFETDGENEPVAENLGRVADGLPNDNGPPTRLAASPQEARPKTPSRSPAFWGDTAVGEGAAAGSPDRAETTDGAAVPEGRASGETPSDGVAPAAGDEDSADAVATDADPRQAEDPLAVLTNRLKELGATHYRLETWGPEGRMFRFRCSVAMPNGSRATRYFQAIASQPLKAVQQVSADIESWVEERDDLAKAGAGPTRR